MKLAERKVMGRYRPYIWIPDHLRSFIGDGPAMTFQAAVIMANRLAGDQSRPILARTLVDILSLGAWLRSSRRVVRVEADLVRALFGTDPRLTPEDMAEWVESKSPWLTTWFQFDEEASPIIFPSDCPVPMTEMLVFITPDYGKESTNEIIRKSTLRVYAINSPRNIKKTPYGPAPDTDVLWCHWPAELPITTETLKKHNWERPEQVLPGVLEDIKDISILNHAVTLAANLMCYMHSDGAIIEKLEGPRKKDKQKTDYWRIGRTFKLSATEAPVKREVKGGWTLSYRFWVSGHWRMQPYGPERALRKRIWIEPYQKGPDIADKIHGGGDESRKDQERKSEQAQDRP